MTELNKADVSCALPNSEAYSKLVDIFSPWLILGANFVTDEEALKEVETKGSNETKISAQLTELKTAVQRMQEEQKVQFSALRTEICESERFAKESEYLKLAQSVKDTPVPFPFETATECEKFLSSAPWAMDAAKTAFAHNAIVKAKKTSLRKRAKQGGKDHGKADQDFPAGILTHFLFATGRKGKVAEELQGRAIGPATKAFIVDRSQYLMGPTWGQPDSWIMTRIQKNLSYHRVKKQ